MGVAEQRCRCENWLGLNALRYGHLGCEEKVREKSQFILFFSVAEIFFLYFRESQKGPLRAPAVSGIGPRYLMDVTGTAGGFV